MKEPRTIAFEWMGTRQGELMTKRNAFKQAKQYLDHNRGDRMHLVKLYDFSFTDNVEPSESLLQEFQDWVQDEE